MILTHQHIDHLGLVSLVAQRSGAEVAAIDVAVPFVENYSQEAQADDEFAREVMLRNGIPEDVVSALQLGVAGVPRLGRPRRRDARAPRRRGDELPRPHARRCTTAPGTAPPTRSSTTASAAC